MLSHVWFGGPRVGGAGSLGAGRLPFRVTSGSSVGWGVCLVLAGGVRVGVVVRVWAVPAGRVAPCGPWFCGRGCLVVCVCVLGVCGALPCVGALGLCVCVRGRWCLGVALCFGVVFCVCVSVGAAPLVSVLFPGARFPGARVSVSWAVCVCGCWSCCCRFLCALSSRAWCVQARVFVFWP